MSSERDVPDWWDDVPIDAYEDDGEAAPSPSVPGETRSPVYYDPIPDPATAPAPVPSPEPEPAPQPSAPASTAAGGFGLYLRLKGEGFNSQYAAEQAVRHIREEQRRAEEGR